MLRIDRRVLNPLIHKLYYIFIEYRENSFIAYDTSSGPMRANVIYLCTGYH